MTIQTEWKSGALILVVFATFVFVMFVIFKGIVPFLQDKKFIENEMERTDGATYCYWENELKKLYLSQIPLIGKYLALQKKMKQ